MYIKLINEIPIEYSIHQLRSDNPQVSFPDHISEELLAEYDIYHLTPTDIPTYDPIYQNIREDIPTIINDTWVQTWKVEAASENEIAERMDECENNIRLQRTALLQETDWMALNDSTLSTEWKMYRQALRDITAQEGFPCSVEWPEKPV